jgi:hypothetical protein
MNSMMPIVTSERDPISALSPYIDHRGEANGTTSNCQYLWIKIFLSGVRDVLLGGGR